MAPTSETKTVQPNIQDVFLNYVRREKLTITVRMMDGTELEGRIKNFDRFAVVLDHPFPVFPNGFPAAIIESFSRATGRGVLGNKAASGTQIIDELGAEHMRTGSLIVYTSADSVFQIAAHEAVVPVPELYRACEIAFDLVAVGLGVGRVIARPFVGKPGAFTRTAK